MIASPSTYPCQWVNGSVIDSFGLEIAIASPSFASLFLTQFSLEIRPLLGKTNLTLGPFFKLFTFYFYDGVHNCHKLTKTDQFQRYDNSWIYVKSLLVWQKTKILPLLFWHPSLTNFFHFSPSGERKRADAGRGGLSWDFLLTPKFGRRNFMRIRYTWVAWNSVNAGRDSTIITPTVPYWAILKSPMYFKLFLSLQSSCEWDIGWKGDLGFREAPL